MINPEGNYYELTETNEIKVEKILKAAKYDYDPECIKETVILQCKEDFSNKTLYVYGHVFDDLSDNEFEKILEAL